ncbi:hypothetical protein NA57DRAFT_50910 [Rhizodiscina lignyota]|uniref:Uncharacterized protein n=1 Tax=Rhizodiscina lignyota TaxID=1504668 RepID=A0A9P4MB77_9PEZI|nr:hypothetical protein NA57DRAFT_50910 [Rhizodiscina lignyota]
MVALKRAAPRTPSTQKNTMDRFVTKRPRLPNQTSSTQASSSNAQQPFSGDLPSSSFNTQVSNTQVTFSGGLPPSSFNAQAFSAQVPFPGGLSSSSSNTQVSSAQVPFPGGQPPSSSNAQVSGAQQPFSGGQPPSSFNAQVSSAQVPFSAAQTSSFTGHHSSSSHQPSSSSNVQTSNIQNSSPTPPLFIKQVFCELFSLMRDNHKLLPASSSKIVRETTPESLAESLVEAMPDGIAAALSTGEPWNLETLRNASKDTAKGTNTDCGIYAGLLTGGTITMHHLYVGKTEGKKKVLYDIWRDYGRTIDWFPLAFLESTACVFAHKLTFLPFRICDDGGAECIRGCCPHGISFEQVDEDHSQFFGPHAHQE